jgi:hypothetical protein
MQGGMQGMGQDFACEGFFDQQGLGKLGQGGAPTGSACYMLLGRRLGNM